MSTSNKFIKVMDNEGDVLHLRKSAINVILLHDNELKLKLTGEAAWIHSALIRKDIPKLLEDISND